MTKKLSELVLYRGDKFASQGQGKFAKDVVRVGQWRHPATGRAVEFDSARIKKLAANTNEYLANGNKVPFPDGHSFSVKDNLGFWPGPFLEHQGALVGVVEPKDELAAKKMIDGSLDSVSAMIEYGVTDPKGKTYDEVITHVCATNYPVITQQKAFVELSQVLDAQGRALLAPNDLDLEFVDKAAQLALDQLAQALAGDPFEACVLQLKRKGSSKEDAVASCQRRFKAAKMDRIAAAFKELAQA